MKALQTMHGDLPLPSFLPDATRGAVRTLDAADVADCGIDALMVNVLHLSARPGASLLAQAGGIHEFMNWRKPIASDSGGFQAFSLATGAAKLGTVSNHGFTYRLTKGGAKKTLTPEKCIQRQFQLQSDILFCLDHCTHPEADRATQRESVDHTVEWGKRCKAEFERRLERFVSDTPRPLLFGIVQGGNDPDLRRECADRLLELGFDGFGYGGWPIDSGGGLVDMVAHVAELIPRRIPKHALGIGKPENVVRAFDLGYDLFDCTIPTRDARHMRLYVLADDGDRVASTAASLYTCLNMAQARFARDNGPVDPACDCRCCTGYSRAYLHFLFMTREPLAHRLATIHNLRTYARLMYRLQGTSKNG